MSSERPTFLVRNNSSSSYFFRSVIPRDLRPKFNNANEFRLSLKTGILSEARRISSQLKFEADTIFQAIQCGDISETCVVSIKERLKNLRDRLLLGKMKGGGPEVENLRPAKRNGTPPEPVEKMELSKEDSLKIRKEMERQELEDAKETKKAFKLLKSYFHRFGYQDIMEYCEAVGLDFTETMFPKRYVRKCRQSVIKQLEGHGDIEETAYEIAFEVIEAHIDSLSLEEFAEFFPKTKFPPASLRTSAPRKISWSFWMCMAIY